MTIEIHVDVPPGVEAAARRSLARQGVTDSKDERKLRELLRRWAVKGLMRMAADDNLVEHRAQAIARINARDAQEAIERLITEGRACTQCRKPFEDGARVVCDHSSDQRFCSVTCAGAWFTHSEVRPVEGRDFDRMPSSDSAGAVVITEGLCECQGGNPAVVCACYSEGDA